MTENAACRPSFEKCVFRSFAHFLIELLLFFDTELLAYFRYESFDNRFIGKYFLPFHGLSFCFVYSFLCCANAFSKIRSYLFIFAFIFINLVGE